jgi:hypothetical protein
MNNGGTTLKSKMRKELARIKIPADILTKRG